ncbi:polynucleotide adenylyltransferase PcnB [candidate division CSSED10-310 bacterium]|uniref:Poly(A) polymerase I n=1 Tax=candidate division CSSED10-310 bacterium TaxID=2855610 RepID=A0ABV6YU71_UNCC1
MMKQRETFILQEPPPAANLDPSPLAQKPLVIQRSQHSLSRKNIDKNALKVLYRLHRSGFKAYLVGGSVRDLLLGRKPKDFDVATNARPYKIKKLFRNAFLIGRRFRLAHIKFKFQTIEVSTFRKQGPPHPSISKGERVRSENTYGSPGEDAFRRDFTINALFYNIANFTVLDYTGGYHDLQKGLVRAIGEPEQRFREDPVRMLRAVRVAARLGFGIESTTYQALQNLHPEIMKASSPRLLEELLVLYKMGSSHRSFAILHQTGLLKSLFPEIETILTTISAPKRTLFLRYLAQLDNLHRRQGEQPPEIFWGTFFLACMHMMYPGNDTLFKDRDLTAETFHKSETLLKLFSARFTIPRKQRYLVKSILQVFPHLVRPKAKAKVIRKIKKQPFYPDALILLNIYKMVQTQELSNQIGTLPTCPPSRPIHPPGK